MYPYIVPSAPREQAFLVDVLRPEPRWADIEGQRDIARARSFGRFLLLSMYYLATALHTGSFGTQAWAEDEHVWLVYHMQRAFPPLGSKDPRDLFLIPRTSAPDFKMPPADAYLVSAPVDKTRGPVGMSELLYMLWLMPRTTRPAMEGRTVRAWEKGWTTEAKLWDLLRRYTDLWIQVAAFFRAMEEETPSRQHETRDVSFLAGGRPPRGRAVLK